MSTDYTPPSEEDLMDRGELREHLKDKTEKIAGTRELHEANRRCSVLNEWRVGDGN